MAHANTSLNFQEALSKYPCENLDYCDAIGAPCKYRNDQDKIGTCPERQYILSHTIKMCDSGIFTKEGAMLTYTQMFEAYERMGIEYGVMIDVFRDSQATLESAKNALEAYGPYQEKFKLVAVAQGVAVEEYVECYRGLKELGFTYIAVGGLLQRVEETVRYAQVRDENFMYEVLDVIRAEYPDDWLFALGCFHPNRLVKFKERSVWGDYKGWIFQYKKRNEALNSALETFASNHLRHLENKSLTKYIAGLQNIITERSTLIEEQKNLSRQLNQGRRELRAMLEKLHKEVVEKLPGFAAKFAKLTSHGLLKPNEESLVYRVLEELEKSESTEAKELVAAISSNRRLKEQIETLEKQVDQINILLVKSVKKLETAKVTLPEAISEACKSIVNVVQTTEQKYRLQQVRQKMAQEILNLL